MQSNALDKNYIQKYIDVAPLTSQTQPKTNSTQHLKLPAGTISRVAGGPY